MARRPTAKPDSVERPAGYSKTPPKTNDSGAVIHTDAVLANPLTVGVLILAVLAVIAALYIGKAVVLPVVFAIVLKLLFQPILDFLCLRLRLPTAAGAFILILSLFAVIGAVAFAASGPASGWVKKIPDVLPTLKDKLVVLRRPIDFMQQSFKEISDVAAPAGGDGKTVPVAVKEPSPLAEKFMSVTMTTVAELLTTMIVLFFLLAAGDRLLRGFVEVLPHFSDKRQAVDIATEIQRQIGGYLVTITLMNAAVGIVTGAAMWSVGLGDPILWGSAAFLLNYVPVLGPVTGIVIFLVAGIVTLDWPWHAVMPALVYLLIHIAEGEIITPMLLAKRFTLNPVLVIVSLFFWHGMWGVPGALLAVPLLAMIKIVCDRVEVLKPAGHVIGA